MSLLKKVEPPHEKTNSLHVQNQRRKSASQYQRLCFRYTFVKACKWMSLKPSIKKMSFKPSTSMDPLHKKTKHLGYDHVRQNCSICVAKVKAQLICAFDLAYADCWFSAAAAHSSSKNTNYSVRCSFSQNENCDGRKKRDVSTSRERMAKTEMTLQIIGYPSSSYKPGTIPITKFGECGSQVVRARYFRSKVWGSIPTDAVLCP